MKKLFSVIGIFIILLLVYLLVEYAQLRQPSFIAINNAVSWAESLGAQRSFPCVEESGSHPSFMNCGTFMAASYGSPLAPYSYILWTTLDKHLGDWNAPRGSLVFFGRNAGTPLGHVALCTGNGEIIEAGYDLIKTSTISDENWNSPYLGWAWPPSSWPGRSGGSATAAFIMNMDKFIKERIKSALLQLHIY
jgi:hypothetical protein